VDDLWPSWWWNGRCKPSNEERLYLRVGDPRISMEIAWGLGVSLVNRVSMKLHWRVKNPRSILGELVRCHLTSHRECVSPRLHSRMWDSRSTFGELVRGLLTSPEEYISSNMHRRIGDPRSIPDELVRSPYASPKECVNLRLY
jgi:hypothetical protein